MTVKIEPMGLAEIESRLEAFEQVYEMPSSQFIQAFRNGQLEETEAFREWSTLIAARLVITRPRAR